jgi:tripartite-type tricarboxylate transporter receptor subunit TctC
MIFFRKPVPTFRDHALAVLLTIAAGMLTASPAHSQVACPGQTIRFIVPYAAGGLPDTVARLVGQRLQERIGQSVVVENRPGGNGSIAAASLAGAPADGCNLLVTDGSIVSINPRLYAKLSYDPARDFVPVALLARAPLFLAVHPKVPVATLKEFIDHAKARPGQLTYGSSGVGSTHHLSMEAVKAALKLEMTHVPFRGTGQSVPALLGGHVDVLFSAYPSLSGAVASNSVKLIATNGAKRSPQAPDLPPLADVIPGFDFAPIVGILAPSGTPAPVIQRIAAEAVAAVAEPEIVRRLMAVGIEPAAGGPEDFARTLKSETDRVAQVVEAAGLKPE